MGKMPAQPTTLLGLQTNWKSSLRIEYSAKTAEHNRKNNTRAAKENRTKFISVIPW
jgi:hypothetical protein